MDGDDSCTPKRTHAQAYIELIAKEYADTFASVGDSDNLSTSAKQIPHHDVTSFWKEYQFYCKMADEEDEVIAELTTFRNVFNAMEKKG